MKTKLNDGWLLIDGVKQAMATPLTFAIPDLEDRAALRKGQVVKLGVRNASPEWKGRMNGERFWVRVLGKGERETYLGKVEQIDMVSARDHGVSHEDEIEFGPRHVLDVLDESRPTRRQ